MPARIESILMLEVPVIVHIAGRTMSLEDVMAMAPGTIIELPKSADDDLEILVNNKPIGTGTAVKVGENFGVRVTYIGDLTERINAMGEGALPEDDDAVDPDDAPEDAGPDPD